MRISRLPAARVNAWGCGIAAHAENHPSV